MLLSPSASVFRVAAEASRHPPSEVTAELAKLSAGLAKVTNELTRTADDIKVGRFSGWWFLEFCSFPRSCHSAKCGTRDGCCTGSRGACETTRVWGSVDDRSCQNNVDDNRALDGPAHPRPPLNATCVVIIARCTRGPVGRPAHE